MKKWIINVVATAAAAAAIGYVGLKFLHKKSLEKYHDSLDLALDFFKAFHVQDETFIVNYTSIRATERRWIDCYVGKINEIKFEFHIIVDANANQLQTNEDRLYCLVWQERKVLMTFGPLDTDEGAKIFREIHKALKHASQTSSDSQPS